MEKILTSKNSLLLIIATLLISLVYRDFATVITWDTMGQYCYLPSFFIDGTFLVPLSHFESLNEVYNFSSTLYQFNVVDDVAFTKYTAGLAVLLSPFFLLGHFFAHLLGYTIDGYSLPYAYAFTIGLYFYFILGFVYLKKLLKLYFSDKIVALVLLLIFFGTNLFHNLMFGGTFTHSLSFVLIAFLLWHTIQFHKDPTVFNGVLVGVVLGLIGLTRVPNLLVGLIPVFCGITNYGSFKGKILHFYRNHLAAVFVALISFLVVFGVQVLFWKQVTGSYLINSYSNNPGEGLDFLSPHTYSFLFSFRKGWILYTPMALVLIFGLVKRWRDSSNQIVLIVTFATFLYVVSSWSTWWYAESFSQRAMVDIYAVLSLGLGFLLENKKWRKYFQIPIVLFLVLNLFQTWQVQKGVLPGDNITKEYYLSTFGQVKQPSKEQLDLLQLNEIDYFNKPVEEMLLEPLTSWVFELEDEVLNKDNSYSEEIMLSIEDYYSYEDLYLLEATWTYNEESYTSINGLIPNVSAFYKDKSYAWKGGEVGNVHFSENEGSNTFTLAYLVPHLRTKGDSLRFQVWRRDDVDIELNKLNIQLNRIIK